MRDLRELDAFRVRLPGYPRGDSGNGAFSIDSPNGSHQLKVIASNGGDWDHVSVSINGNAVDPPDWEDMDFIARLFFKDDETAMQLHVPRSDHVNYHQGCLHLWRPRRGKPIPRPPAIYVGPSAKEGT